MAPYLGDYRRGQTVRVQWNSFAATGASVTRAVNGTISVYKDGGTTQTVTGVTDTEDFDALTGVHDVAIATTDAFYVPGSDYTIVLAAATIDGQTVNAVLGHFSLENRFNGEIRKATAQGGAAGTITLDAGASATDDFYTGHLVYIESGTGALQARVVAAYNGTTKVATVDRNWSVTPDATSVVRLYPGSLGPTSSEIGVAVNAAVEAGTVGSGVVTLLEGQEVYKKGVAVTAFVFPVELTTGSPGTGLTVTCQLSKDGGAFAGVAGAVTEIGSGWYKVDLSQAEMTADEIAVTCTAAGAGAKQTNLKIRTQS